MLASRSLSLSLPLPYAPSVEGRMRWGERSERERVAQVDRPPSTSRTRAWAAPTDRGVGRRREIPQLITASHVRSWLFIVVTVVVVGTAGYMLLGGWNPSDALYMTVITLTTVGFREVVELTEVTRAWTMIMAAAGVGLIFGSVGIVAEYALTEVTSGRR